MSLSTVVHIGSLAVTALQSFPQNFPNISRPIFSKQGAVGISTVGRDTGPMLNDMFLFQSSDLLDNSYRHDIPADLKQKKFYVSSSRKIIRRAFRK